MCVHEETNTVFAAHGVRVHGVHVAASALCTVREYRASAEVMDVAVSDVLLCVATLSGRVLLFDIEGAFALWDLDAHIGAASCLAVVDSSLLLSAGEDGAVRLWALATGVCVQERRNVHRRPISALTYVYGSTDRVLITASTDGSVRCTKQTSGIEVGHFATLATCLCVVPNTDSGKSWGHGPTLLVGGPTGALARYRLDRALTRM
jgi:WD40 repeat protein